MQIGSPTNIRRHNRDLVLKLIVENKALSRTDLVKQTGLTGAAISRITRELIEAGLLKEGETIPLKGKAGRRNVRLELNDDGAFVLGITLTGNVRSVSIANCKGDSIAHTNVRLLDFTDPVSALKSVALAARKLIAETPFDQSRLLGAGISIAGRADSDTGILIASPPLGWDDIPVGEILSEALDLPVHVEGRAVALLKAELNRGLARDVPNVVLINNGLGLGGSVAIDGKVLLGRDHMVGQIAHFALQGEDTKCACGRHGCLEAIASGSAILARLASEDVPIIADGADPGLRLNALAALRGPEAETVTHVFKEAGRSMGHAVDSILSMLNPDLVLLAGAAGRQPDYLDGVRETLTRLRGNEDAARVRASAVTSNESAIWLGLGAFIYSQALNIERLIAA